MSDALKIYFADPDDLPEARLTRICTLINAAYLKGEAGMWKDDLPRTYPEEVAGKIRSKQLIIAELGDLIVGTVSVQLSQDGMAGIFGMLAVDGEYTQRGVGARLIERTEQWAIANGMREMRLELLKPAEWEHPAKEALQRWYTKLGYRPQEEMSFYELYPEPGSWLKTVCDFTLWVKDLKTIPDTD